MRIEASTRAWAPQDRLERWREQFGRLVVRADVLADERAPDRFAVDVALLDGAETRLGLMRHDAVVTARDCRLVRDGSEELTLFLMLGGSFDYRSDAHDGTLAAGEMALFSHTVPTRARWARAEALTLFLPRASVAPAVDPERANGAKLAGGTVEAALLRSYAETVWRAGSLSPLAERHLGELALAALGAPEERRPERDSALAEARLARVRAELALLADEPSADLARLARRLGLSSRTVQRELGRAGTSFGDELARIRLDRALAALCADGAELRRISAIAYDVGFRDLSHFNRQFRARFGMTPTDARAEALLARRA